MPNKLRLKLVFVGFIILWVVVIQSLVRIQLFNQSTYKKRADEQFKKQVKLEAQRGSIFDRHGQKLAHNDVFYHIYIELKPFQKLEKEDREAIKNGLVRYLGFDKKPLEAKLKLDRHTILLKQNVAKSVFDKLQSVQLPASKKSLSGFRELYGTATLRRTYDAVANNVLGFVNTDNEGIAGLEKHFQSTLKGQDGFKVVQKDALGKTFSRTGYKQQAPIDGNNIQLTIDRFHQGVLENELALALDRYKAKTTSGIIMDPYTGEILAMASAPSFNSNNPNSATGAELHGANRVVLDTYEPGSTFKIITAAAVLEEGKKKPTDIIYCENGKFRYGPKVYRDDKHKFGNLTFQEVIEKSSNIGTIKLALDLGSQSFYRYVRDFGFGQKIGIAFEGESAGRLRKPEEWSKISLPSMSFGHEISVTSLQMAQAYAAIANGGELIRPFLVKKVVKPNGEILEEQDVQVIRRVISTKTAKTLTQFLKAVVSSGTGQNANNADLNIAGKTGTAQVFDVERGTYSNGKVVASFAGFFPADKPKYVAVIVINEPRFKHLNYGGWTAAPTFERIAEQLIGSETFVKDEDYRYMQTDTSNIFVPDLNGLLVDEAKLLLKGTGLAVSIEGEGKYVIAQSVKAGEYQKQHVTKIELVADEKFASVMPNLKGLALRDALRKLKRFHLSVKVVGSGNVKGQSIKAGKIVKKDDVLTLTCVGK